MQTLSLNPGKGLLFLSEAGLNVIGWSLCRSLARTLLIGQWIRATSFCHGKQNSVCVGPRLTEQNILCFGPHRCDKSVQFPVRAQSQPISLEHSWKWHYATSANVILLVIFIPLRSSQQSIRYRYPTVRDDARCLICQFLTQPVPIKHAAHLCVFLIIRWVHISLYSLMLKKKKKEKNIYSALFWECLNLADSCFNQKPEMN